jgi:hypothetical protein
MGDVVRVFRIRRKEQKPDPALGHFVMRDVIRSDFTKVISIDRDVGATGPAFWPVSPKNPIRGGGGRRICRSWCSGNRERFRTTLLLQNLRIRQADPEGEGRPRVPQDGIPNLGVEWAEILWFSSFRSRFLGRLLEVTCAEYDTGPGPGTEAERTGSSVAQTERTGHIAASSRLPVRSPECPVQG